MIGKVVVSVFSLILVVGVVIGVIAIVQHGGTKSSTGSGSSAGVSTSTRTVTQLCQPTDYKEACEKTLGSVKNSSDPKEYVKAAILATVEAAKKSFNLSTSLITKADDKDKDVKLSLEDCKDLLEDAVQELQASFSTVGDSDLHTMSQRTAELQNWLSAVISYQQTCLDQFGDPNSKYRTEMKDGMLDATQLTSNALAIINGFAKFLSSFNLQLNIPGISQRKLLSLDGDLPEWMSIPHRRLLAAGDEIKPNFTVTQDGSGDFKTVAAALAKCPLSNQSACVIYVKAGTYKEYITVEKKQFNVFMYGDGPRKTIITGDHSNSTGWKTMRSATFAALGTGFTAKSMTFENTAGPEGHQAVALRVQADQTAFFDCSIEGYQDTLYTQAHRQFYNNCTISGTIDFIFGDASVVIQNSNIVMRLPMKNQANTLSAHGRADKHETTGLVITKCKIIPEPKLEPTRTTVKSFLGRPWRAYSRTIVMESEIGDVIQPEGWSPWSGDLFLDTLEYSEYANTGAGAATDKRVKWKGFHILTSKADVNKFSVNLMIQGNEWLNHTGLSY
ncbi:Plant invertase/pectin methylesterase inhibitor superfamily [Euphorbia peplus]|nr:Plant invertase/pectin methylesterase inhibitor superfamily [Euphorbia peplus]